MTEKYDKTSTPSILAYAKKLTGSTLAEMVDTTFLGTIRAKGKGGFGTLVERAYFEIEPPNTPVPDFPEAGLELKTSPLAERKNGKYRTKERLVLGIIDYKKMAGETWESSSFLSKNAKLLLLFYRWRKDEDTKDHKFVLADVWEFSDRDLEIIRGDWEIIHQKTKDSRAHELSESDTDFLAACTKGESGETQREQFGSDTPATQRALSLKASYIFTVYLRLSGQDKGEFQSLYEKAGAGMRIDEVVLKRFRPFIGMEFKVICEKFGVKPGKAKGQYDMLSRLIMGVRTKKVEEFEKAGIILRTMRIKKNGVPKEDVSFPAFDYSDVIKGDWESSDLRARLNRKFFFVIYQMDGKKLVLKAAKFWSMPFNDREKEAKKVWSVTREKINKGDLHSFPKKSDGPVVHVRPHAKNKKDVSVGPDGSKAVKRSFWLNAKYLAEQLKLK